MQRKRGFTLIELLVVIAIIAILAAILFPVFQKVRENARRSACLSNMKQISLAITQYTQDYDETFPLADWDSNTVNPNPVYGFNPWNVDIAPYVKSLAVFNCPDDSGAGIPLPTGAGGGWAGVGMSYACNALTGWYYPPWDGPHLIGMFGYPKAGQAINNHLDGSATLSQLNSPSDDIMLCEKHTDDLMKANSGAWNSTGWGVCSAINNWEDWNCQGYGTPADARNPGPEDAFNASYVNGSVSHKHTNNVANFAFADGHVKAMKPYLTNTATVNMWDIRH